MSARVTLLVAGLAGLVALAVASLAVRADGRRERIGNAPAIVVLGSTVRRDGTPSRRLVARLSRGLELWRQGRAPVIIVSSGVIRGIDEAHVMKTWLLAQGVPDSAVIEDPNGRNTWETARFVSRWLAERRGHSVIAVSQYFHLPRCRLALRRFGVDTVYTSGPDFAEWREFVSVPRDVAGLVKYALRPAPRPLPEERRP